ncbi:MAG: alpha/beta hydrolase [Eggerthellaceae bacterium]|nr:alpha/beta hydrolase [Eggerthellaceae bacterium]
MGQLRKNGYTTSRLTVTTASKRALTLLMLRPKKSREPLPGVLWIHGGGYLMGMASMVHASRAAQVAREGLGVVISPAYRLACRHPYPAAVTDCYNALVYLKDHASQLGVRDDQLFVGGESAGGGLAAAVCMMARDRGEVNVAFQMPLYPMIDCFDTDTSRDNHGRVWNTRRNHWGWNAYLGALAGTTDVPPYASPARQTDYAGLPPAYSFACTGEPFLSETQTYITNLKAAGIEACMDVYPGDVHAFDMLLPWQPTSRAAAAAFMRHYRDACDRFHAPQPAKASPQAGSTQQ